MSYPTFYTYVKVYTLRWFKTLHVLYRKRGHGADQRFRRPITMFSRSKIPDHYAPGRHTWRESCRRHEDTLLLLPAFELRKELKSCFLLPLPLRFFFPPFPAPGSPAAKRRLPPACEVSHRKPKITHNKKPQGDPGRWQMKIKDRFLLGIIWTGGNWLRSPSGPPLLSITAIRGRAAGI